MKYYLCCQYYFAPPESSFAKLLQMSGCVVQENKYLLANNADISGITFPRQKVDKNKVEDQNLNKDEKNKIEHNCEILSKL